MRGDRDDNKMSHRRDAPTLVLANYCRVQFGRASTRSGILHLCDSAVAGPAARRDNVLASTCEYPLSVTSILINLPDFLHVCKHQTIDLFHVYLDVL